jgi:hypothetical protein
LRRPGNAPANMGEQFDVLIDVTSACPPGPSTSGW